MAGRLVAIKAGVLMMFMPPGVCNSGRRAREFGSRPNAPGFWFLPRWPPVFWLFRDVFVPDWYSLSLT